LAQSEGAGRNARWAAKLLQTAERRPRVVDLLAQQLTRHDGPIFAQLRLFGILRLHRQDRGN
jgi:hypothetical protein